MPARCGASRGCRACAGTDRTSDLGRPRSEHFSRFRPEVELSIDPAPAGAGSPVLHRVARGEIVHAGWAATRDRRGSSTWAASFRSIPAMCISTTPSRRRPSVDWIWRERVVAWMTRFFAQREGPAPPRRRVAGEHRGFPAAREGGLPAMRLAARDLVWKLAARYLPAGPADRHHGHLEGGEGIRPGRAGIHGQLGQGPESAALL